MNPSPTPLKQSKQDEAEDHAAALMNVAAWFARWIVADELGVHDDIGGIYSLPESFRELVAMSLVVNKSVGCLNMKQALDLLAEIYHWGPE